MTTMTRIHFNLIADAMKESKPDPEEYSNKQYCKIALLTWEQSVIRLADKFTRTNPSFNVNCFFEACGLEQ